MQAGPALFALARRRCPGQPLPQCDLNGLVHGLKDWPRQDRPVVPIVFFAFHLVVVVAVIVLGIVVRGLLLFEGRRVYTRRGYSRRADLPSGPVIGAILLVALPGVMALRAACRSGCRAGRYERPAP